MTTPVAPVRYDFAPLGDLNGTRELAKFVARTGFEDLGDPVVEQVRRFVIDCVGVGLGAVGEEDLPILLDYVNVLGGIPQATVWGRPDRLNVAQAAMVNSQLSAILDMDDTYLSDLTTYHGSSQVIPAALAIAEWKGLGGKELMTAIALGHEVSMRVLLSAGITFHRQRWYTVSTFGPFGAAAACGKLLGLDEDQLVHALGIAGVQAVGSIEPLGSMTGGFQYARSAVAGVEAALLAQRGFTAGKDILTGKFGFHTVFHSDQNLDRLYGDLGSRWNLLETGFKPFACGINLHALLAGVIAVRNAQAIEPADVEAIELRINPHVLVPSGLKNPVTGREGKFSVYHSAAIALIDGECGPRQYTDAKVTDPLTISLRERVVCTPDDSVRRDEAFVTVRLRDGRVIEQRTAHAPGTLADPFSNEALVEKARSFILPVLGPVQTQRLIAAVEHLEDIADCSVFARLLAVSKAGQAA